LRAEGDHVAGILNGIDYTLFDPATDEHLVATFDAGTLDRRAENKRELQRELGLPVEDSVPVAGMVSRLFVQKGADLAVEAVRRLLPQRSFQLVVLGSGEEGYERALLDLAAREPERVAVRIAFDVALGQRIYGGSDLFLMPSRYEPCGLGQMIAMRYGSIPVVRRTGGLADSVQPYAADAGTGFLFDDATPEAAASALAEAFTVYEDRAAWQALQRRAMAQDFSWRRSAHEYAALYERAVRRHGGAGSK
jgi:starch synthase